MLGLGIYLEANKSKNAFKEYSSKTLEYVYLNGIYDEKYKDEYDKIKFDNQENFSMVLTTFLPKGYSGDEINYIFSLSDKNINKLKNIDYIDIKDFYNIKNFYPIYINFYYITILTKN